jgi:DNA-directed RNA polymerase subunit E'/Rpb7
LGTQFKNIVKINYLTEAIKQKFPEKIDKNLNIPHIIDYEEFNKSGVLRSPEIAIIALTPNKFKKIQKKQIKAELKKSYEEL